MSLFGLKHYEVLLCKNLLLRFLFTCGSTSHFCGGVGDCVGLVCMNCVTTRPLLPPSIICHIKTSKKGLALIEVRVIQLLTVFANYYLNKKSTELSIHHLMQLVSTCKSHHHFKTLVILHKQGT